MATVRKKPSRIDELVTALSGIGAVSSVEAELQRMVRDRLQQRGVAFEEQVATDSGCRFDFVIDEIAVELKIKGGLAPLLRQIDRYAQEKLKGIIVVSTRRQLLVLPAELRGMPVRGVWIGCL